MRSHVLATAWFFLRNEVEGVLNFLPNLFAPRYGVVAFTRIPFQKVIEKGIKQDKLIDVCLVVTGCWALVFRAYQLHATLQDIWERVWLGCIAVYHLYFTTYDACPSGCYRKRNIAVFGTWRQTKYVVSVMTSQVDASGVSVSRRTHHP